MFKMYGKEQCPYCVRAKELLASKGQEFEYIDVVAQPEAREFLVQNGFKTVPQIYDSAGEHIGGFDDLVVYYKEG